MFAQTQLISVMKKIAALLLCISVVTFNSCENEPLDEGIQTGPTSCEAAILNTAEESLNFLGANVDNYTQLCIAYRNALAAQIAICGDEDGTLQLAVDALGDCTDENQQTSDLEGTWLLTAWLGESPFDLNNDGTESVNFLDEMDCYTNETIVFNSDGTAVAMSTSYAEFEVFIEVGTTDQYDYTITCIQENDNTDATWTQAGNSVTIEDEFGDVSEWTLSGNQLSIVVPEGFFAISEDATLTVTEDLTFVYTKQ